MNTSTDLSAEELSAIVVDAAFHLHFTLGCGLLESVYQNVLAAVLRKKGLSVKTETPVVFEYDGIRFDDNLKTDLIVNEELIVELKSVEQLAPVHHKQLLTYLRLTGKPLGLLINFGGANFKENCHRILNGDVDLSTASQPMTILRITMFGLCVFSHTFHSAILLIRGVPCVPWLQNDSETNCLRRGKSQNLEPRITRIFTDKATTHPNKLDCGRSLLRVFVSSCETIKRASLHASAWASTASRTAVPCAWRSKEAHTKTRNKTQEHPNTFRQEAA